MNKQFLFLLTLLVVSTSTPLLSQNDFPCGYKPDAQYLKLCKDPNSLLNKRINFIQQFSLQKLYNIQQLENNSGQYRVARQPLEAEGTNTEEKTLLKTERLIPIVAHIVRKSNGTEGLTERQLNDAVRRANGFYNSFNMRFEVCEIKYIDSDKIHRINFNSEADNDKKSTASYKVLSVKTRNVANKLNIYFVPNSNTSWAWRPETDKNKQHIMMLNSQATNGVTLSHEIGHWFNLLHTHDEGDELVDGSNCKKAGDFICDTPADPNLSGLVNSSCTYTGGANIKDANWTSLPPRYSKHDGLHPVFLSFRFF